MTFTNRLEQIMPGWGQPVTLDTSFLAANTALSGTGQASTTLPSSGSWSPTISKGRGRIKIYSGTGTSPTLTDILVTGSDGTNTVELFVFHPNTAVTLSSTSLLDLLFNFMTDLNLTSITIKTTLGGTSPGATMDAQISGTI